MAAYHPAHKASGLPAIFGPSTPDPYQPSGGVKYTALDVAHLATVGGAAMSAGVHVGSLIGELINRLRK